jgi:hypothetical protein
MTVHVDMTLEENKEATSKLSLPKNVHASLFLGQGVCKKTILSSFLVGRWHSVENIHNLLC